MINNTRRKERGERKYRRRVGPFSGPKAIYRKILPLLWNTAKTTNIIKGGEQDNKEGNKASGKKKNNNKKNPKREEKKNDIFN